MTATHTGAYDVAQLGLPIPGVPASGERRQWPRECLTFTVRQGLVVARSPYASSVARSPGVLY